MAGKNPMRPDDETISKARRIYANVRAGTGSDHNAMRAVLTDFAETWMAEAVGVKSPAAPTEAAPVEPEAQGTTPDDQATRQHLFTSDGYVHAHDLGRAICVVCGGRYNDARHVMGVPIGSAPVDEPYRDNPGRYWPASALPAEAADT